MSKAGNKTFIFDCFGVLCTPVLFIWYKRYSAQHGFEDGELSSIFKEFDLNRLTEEDIWERFSKYKGVTATAEEIREETDGYLELDQKLVEIIKDLRSKGHKTVLLSNANNSFFERHIYIKHPEFKELFDAIVISSVVNMVKPDREIYEHALSVSGSLPEDSVFIDDSQANVDAAVALGLRGHTYTDSGSFAQFIKEMNS